ncbi:MAG: Hsp70 family protein [Nitrospinota bacterium]
MKNKNDLIVGIDFGTTTSAIGVIHDGAPVLLPVNGEGECIMPSAVAFSKTGEVLVGQSAKKQAILNPERTYLSIKTALGKGKTVNIGNEEWSLEKVAAQILIRLKEKAEAHLKQPVKKAVITVPAYFNQLQRQAVREIGRLAGLKVLRIINEPTAAAMAYGVNQESEQSVLVFDFGGGTFDVSLLTIAEGVFEVKATGGDNRLGGDDIDRLIVDRVAADFKAEHGIDLKEDKMAMQKLKDEAEKVKIALSESDSARLQIPFITADKNGPIHIDRTFTASILETMVSGIIKSLVSLAEETLKSGETDKSQVEHILLAGGSTRIPAVRKAIIKHFGDKVLSGVNPLECVALGAAVQAGILGGRMPDMVLLDITPLKLGLEIEGGGTETIIPQNSTIPVTGRKTFTTVADDQSEVEIKVLQGNSNRSSGNIILGDFILGGIEKGKKGEPKVEVEFDINVDGIMSISARDKKTGIARSIRVTQSVIKKSSGGAPDGGKG